jgi:hypothetical protein
MMIQNKESDMELKDIADYINVYGFPIIASIGMGYIVYYVWTWTTTIIKPILDEAYVVLVTLIDQIRILDSDMIRLKQKLSTVLLLKTPHE